MGKDKPRFDFYENNMFLDDPMQADLTRKARCAAPKIGTEPRVRKTVFNNCIDARKQLGTNSRPVIFAWS